MDNHKVFCGLVIFLQIADLSRQSTYNFSICNHDEIREDLLNVLDPHMTLNEELQLDFHSCDEAPPPPAGPQHSEGWWRAQRAGRLLECVLQGTRGCDGTRHGALWHGTLRVLRRNCRGYRPPQRWQDGQVPPSAGLCDDSKVQELMAMWRSYMNLG